MMLVVVEGGNSLMLTRLSPVATLFTLHLSNDKPYTIFFKTKSHLNNFEKFTVVLKSFEVQHFQKT